ncbi:MAG: 3-phosphoshikimate 1-carboxyvinyltransferase [Rhodothermales bacterium]|nr:3-phosphoshikimate 1-carboxyvinyltransferase [Rhodothermales bacterium]
MTVEPAASLRGEPVLPPDKSIAHRAALFASIADGTSRIVNYPEAEDPQSTLSCLRALGVRMGEQDGNLVIHGGGLHGFQEPAEPLDCGNSGTTMRLLAGLLAGQRFDSTLTGDDSLLGRPMNRIVEPLRTMGARIEARDGRAPLKIRGWGPLRATTYRLPVASAQVKSCVLLAGLYADGESRVIESIPSRDHTERMLSLPTIDFGDGRTISSEGGRRIDPRIWSIPADFSAAAFFLVAGSIVPNSELTMKNVGLNPTRAGLVDVLRAMGADIRIENERAVGSEPIGDLTVRSSRLSGVTIGGDRIPVLIDELPVLAVAGALADGETIIRDAGELRHKETDRIAATAAGLSALGVRVEVRQDGFTIRGGSGLTGGRVESRGDHRIAMAFAVAGLAAMDPVTIEGASCAAVSFPGFREALDALR